MNTRDNPTGQIGSGDWIRGARAWLKEAESARDPKIKRQFIQNAAIHATKALEALEIEGL
jgi:hypothetical protein